MPHIAELAYILCIIIIIFLFFSLWSQGWGVGLQATYLKPLGDADDADANSLTLMIRRWFLASPFWRYW